MKNKLALTALAIAIAAPGAAFATDVTLSGVVQTKLYLINEDVVEGNDPATAATETLYSQDSKAAVAGGDVRFLVTVEETVGAYTGYAHYRMDTDNLSGVSVESDEIRVGIKGGFGNFMLGKDSEVDFGEYANDIHTAQVTSGAALGYTGSFGPVNVEATFSPEGSDDLFGIGAEFAAGPVTIGATAGTVSKRYNSADVDTRVTDAILVGDDIVESDADHFMVGAKGNFGPITVAAHTWTIDTDATTTNYDATGVGTPEATETTEADGYAVKVSGSAGGWSWGLTYDVANAEASTQNIPGSDKGEEVNTRLDLGTTIAGGVDLGIRYNNQDVEITPDGGAKVSSSADFLYVQLSKSF